MDMIKQLLTSIVAVLKDFAIGEWLAHAFGIELY